MRILGIDPGVTGAAVLVDFSAPARPQIIAIFDLKTQKTQQKRSFLDIISLSNFIAENKIDAVICEKMRPAPMIGVVSAFSIGNTMGRIEALSALHGLNFHYVSPHVWKGALGVPADKNAAREHARAIYGAEYFTRRMDHNQSEAALLALYGSRAAAASTHGGTVPQYKNAL